MKNRILVTLLLAALSGSQHAFADEGMWMINTIDAALEKKMRERGLELSAGEIYNADAEGATIADAIVSLEFGCTGSMISDNGLMITNHHCAYGDVHKLSSSEHNYLEEGFWAMTDAEEVNIKGKSVYFLKRVMDVTAEVERLKEEYHKEGRTLGMRKLSHILETRYKENTGLDAWLSSMWGGSKYYMALYEVYKDVRLVAAPPVSSAAFGGDIDNWEWPQHKCDFALYRIYTAPDGSPAEYSEENVPMKPKSKLKISLKGYRPGDYTMVIGYPGRTNRYSSSFETGFNTTLKLPVSNMIRGRQMEIIGRWMNVDPQIRLKYADYYFSLSNVQELYSGQVECCERFDVAQQKEALEEELQEWIESDERYNKRWKTLLADLESRYAAVREVERNMAYYRETLIRGTRLALVMRRAYNARASRVSGEKMRQDYSGMDLRVERELMAYSLKEYVENVDSIYFSTWQKELIAGYISEGRCDTQALCDYLWNNSVFTDADGMERLFREEVSQDEARQDPLCRFVMEVKITDFNKVKEAMEGSPGINELDKEYTHALYRMRMDKGIVQYPDANSTMRLSYGTVGGLEPRDGIICDYKTTTEGILEKYDPSLYDFTLDDRQYLLYRKGDWGRWSATSEGGESTMYVNFMTDNDITGGNSGSPVLNARGELIGLAFDGNKESLASDVWYTPGYNKCVCVDIRFVLWTLERYAGMDRIIAELEFRE